MKKIFLLAVLCLPLFGFSQNDTIWIIDTTFENIEVNKWQTDLYLGNYQQAINAAKEELEDPKLQMHLLDLFPNYYCQAVCFARLSEKDSALTYLNRALSQRIDLRFYLDSNFRKVFTTVQRDSIRTHFTNMMKASFSDFDFDYSATLAYLNANDEYYRNMIDVYIDDEARQHSLFTKQWYLDSINIASVDELVKSRGLPTYKSVGKEGLDAFFIIVQHSDLKHQLKYFKPIKHLSKKGSLSKQNLALLTDRILVKQGKKQIYGSQLHFDEQEMKNKSYPIRNPKNVDKRRKKAGFNETLSEYLKFFE